MPLSGDLRMSDDKPREFIICDDGAECSIDRLNRHGDIGISGKHHVIEMQSYLALQKENAELKEEIAILIESMESISEEHWTGGTRMDIAREVLAKLKKRWGRSE